MGEPDDSSAAALRAFAVAAIAATYLDYTLLDWEWRLLRKFDPRPAPDDILIVGIDPATVNSIPEPPALWHASLGRALTRIAAAKPRAIGLDFPLPERSYDAIHAGLDNALFAGLAAAARNGPFVAVLSIDARTRAARRIHPPYLALLGDSRLGIGLLARDADGVTRQFSLLVPTEDGGYPTLAATTRWGRRFATCRCAKSSTWTPRCSNARCATASFWSAKRSHSPIAFRCR